MSDKASLRVINLLDAPQLAATLEHWFVDEWMPWYGPDGPGDAGGDLAACANRNALPLCLVALSSDDELLGTASLRSESVGSDIGVGPWLAAVIVGKENRRKGVGTALVAAIEMEAARLGFDALFTSTDTARRILERRGWRSVGESQSLRGSVAVYRWDAPAEQD